MSSMVKSCSLATVAVMALVAMLVRADEQCSINSRKNVVVSVRHSVNSTGHPRLTARLEHPHDSGAWQLDVEVGNTCYPPSKPNKVVAVTLNGVSYQPVIPSTYVLVPGMGHYRASTSAHTWMEARDACSAEGAVLVTPTSDREAQLVVKDLPSNATDVTSPNYVWVGLHDFTQEGKFVSLEGVPLEQTGFAKWHPGQPDGGAGESCMVLVKSNVLLADAPCAWKLSYVCKLPL